MENTDFFNLLEHKKGTLGQLFDRRTFSWLQSYAKREIFEIQMVQHLKETSAETEQKQYLKCLIHCKQKVRVTV